MTRYLAIVLPRPAGVCLHGRLSSNVMPHATPIGAASPASMLQTAVRILLTCSALLLGACAATEENVNSGLWHYKAGLYGQAAPKLVRAVPDLEKSNPSDPRVLSGYLALGRMAAADAAYEPAAGYFDKALQLARARHAADVTLTRNALVETGNFLNERKRFLDAIPLLQEAASISQRDSSLPRTLHAMDLDNLALAHAGAGNQVLAMAASDASLKTLDALSPTKDVQATRGVVLYNRAYALAEQGQVAAADATYKEALSLVRANAAPWRTKVVVANYAKFLRTHGRDTEALAIERAAE